MKTIRLCSSCGAALPPDAPEGLCPQCLLKTDMPTLIGDKASTLSPTARPVPIPGETFGNYRILRLLGQGGMGEVYEAEHAESRRRVALKVMGHTLASEQDRKRFLREGRLAASVNHPNVVYVHGSEEISGVPVIAMELVHGGTLKDRLKREGPLPIAEAVEAALQIIAGLEAAHTAGVLHRDIKPANCFVAADRTVKIGDFGLSVSTLARGESLLTAAGSVIGTPGYASPEQLRAEELDVTSDIYSAGATLYHLLTGKPPFPATDFVKLITEVLDKQPEAPKDLRPEIPDELSRILLRCLAKERKARFQTYAALREALLPFGAAEVVPAKPAMRVLADLLDNFLAFIPSLLFLVYWNLSPLENLASERTLTAALGAAACYAWHILYYTLCEGLWGAALGKMICGLRVVGPDRQAPGLLRAFLRTTVSTANEIAPYFLLMALMSAAQVRAAVAQDQWLLTDWLEPALWLLLFVTMRKRNGYAAVHDLVSGTRVIVRPRTQPRPTLAELAGEIRNPQSAIQIQSESPHVGCYGPYELLSSVWKRADEELLLAFDQALRRQVCVHLRRAHSESISAERRDLSRPARLRWLNSGQTETHLWDAYEAVEGVPFLQLADKPQPWRAVRFWLLDLAEELAAALDVPATAPTLSLDRVWISSRGHALLLDFPCSGLAEANDDANDAPDGIEAVQHFLDRIARVALEGRTCARDDSSLPPVPFRACVPLDAMTFLTSLMKHSFEHARVIVGNLESLIAKPAEITRSRRASSLALVPALLFAIYLLVGAPYIFERRQSERQWERAWAAAYPGTPSPRAAALFYSTTPWLHQNGTANEKIREAFQVYFVAHYGPILTNETFWENGKLAGVFKGANRAELRDAVTKHPSPSAEAVAKAERFVQEIVRRPEHLERLVWISALCNVLLYGVTLFALIELIGCLAFGASPMLRLFGIAVVDDEGRPASRVRLFRRWLLGWGCLFLASTLFVAVVVLTDMRLIARPHGVLELPFQGLKLQPHAVLVTLALAAGASAPLLVGLASTIRHPPRGLQDRIVGTALVPK